MARAGAKKPRQKAAAAPETAGLTNLGRYAPTREEYRDFYHTMLLIRRFEEKAGQMYGMGLIGGFCHLYIGQEAVVTGLQTAISPGKDSVVTGYRDHGHMIACHIEPKIIMAELTGRDSGISRGKGGSMHMFSVDHGFYGGHGIVAAQVPIGSGLAFAHKYRGDGGVALTYFGDGATNQGQVYEAFNMASLWKLPVVYVIENNQYAMGTSVSRSTADQELFRRGEAYDIKGTRVDGMDVLAVRAAANMAIDHVRAGNGPILLEMMTYRYRGHSMSDPAKYRTREEVQNVRQTRDPIEHAKKELQELGFADEVWLKETEKQVKAKVAEAAAYAEQAPQPAMAELYTDVLVGNY